ncbi:MAG TPA: caspase family protein [Thermoanaerobaculia bacterium]|jgi:hypothetical protein|nr:caspase family protein [Thermoanaerobaculia bacterium]
MEPNSDTHGRWALLVGIDRYPKLDSRRQLGGCSNDVHILKDALLRRFGFPEDQIQVLLNEQATRTAMLGALKSLVEKVGKDEIVVFHFSGHGSKRRDGPEKDEPDGFDETLVPYDSGRIDEPNLDITDDEIYDWIQKLTAKTRYLTLIFDCCHSGTASRSGRMRKGPDDERPFEMLGAPPVELRNGGDGPRKGPSGWLPLGERYTLFAACGSSESANEILVGKKRPKTPHGALTYYLVQELMSPGVEDKATATEIFERVVPQFKKGCEGQNPQLEGARDREIFGVKTIQPMSFVSVLARHGDKVTLAGGQVCGLLEGSEWTIHGFGTRSVSAATVPLGRVEILSVGVSTCEARIIEELQPESVTPGSRAVEHFRPLERGRLTVEIVAPTGHSNAAELDARIRRSILLEIVSDREPDVRIHLLAPRSDIRDDDSLPDLGALEVETWVAEEDRRPLGSPVPSGIPKAVEIVVENLEVVARLRILTELRNPESPLAGFVRLELFRRDGDGSVEPQRDENGEIFFQENDGLVFAVHNHSNQPVYCYLLDIGLTGRVGLVYPPEGGDKALERNRTLVVGNRGEIPPFFFPPDFLALPEAVRLRTRETLKLIVTTKPTDFRPLFQTGYRFRGAQRGAMASSLEDVLVGRLGLASYRGTTRASSADDWTTLEQSFRLLPRTGAS